MKLTKEQVDLFHIAVKDCRGIQFHLLEAYRKAQEAKTHSPENVFLGSGGMSSFMALVLTKKAAGRRQVHAKQRGELVDFVNKLPDQDLRQCARQLERAMKHEKENLERLLSNAYKRANKEGRFRTNASNGTDAKSSEDDCSLHDELPAVSAERFMRAGA
jgi:hypothetical protein